MIIALKDKILSLNGAAPRYTSYPPATAFHADCGGADYENWLQNIRTLEHARLDMAARKAGAGIAQPATLSLYFHIPFCEKLCYYCGCHTNICNSDAPLADYVKTLCAEIDLVTAHIIKDIPSPQTPPVTHIHFGGGSPTILSPAQFSALMHHIRTRFTITPDADIAIEADPRQMTEALIAAYARNGVTRLSLGVQDFDERVLRAVNRPQPYFLTRDAVEACRAYGIHHINFDLMYGLPGQNVASIEKTVTMALALKPDRIAFFGYAHVPWMKKHMRLMGDMSLPDPALRYDLYEAGAALLKDAGYLPVGIDHFVRPTDSMARALGNRTLRRNFQGYTTDSADTLIGLGASAISKMPAGFIQNHIDLRRYTDAVRGGTLPVAKGYRLAPYDPAYGALISEIMCYLAVDLQGIKMAYDLPDEFFTRAFVRLQPFLNTGLADLDNYFLRVRHPHVARSVASCFDPLQDTPADQARFSHTV